MQSMRFFYNFTMTTIGKNHSGILHIGGGVGYFLFPPSSIHYDERMDNVIEI